MSEKQRKRRDALQNLIITVLSVSTLLLITQTQMYNLGLNTYQDLLSSGTAQTSTSSATQLSTLSAPVRIAVTGPYGRYGSLTMTTANEEFDALGRLLGEVLGSAGAYTACRQQEFLSALEGTSVYYDFLHPLSLAILSDLVGSENEQGISARMIAVASQNDQVALYLWDGETQCYRCTTAVTSESLEAIVDQYELGNAYFAFDEFDLDSSQAAPCSLFLEQTPSLPVLNASVPSIDITALLATLQFNPYTQFRNTESSGTEVIVENNRSLRVRTDGSINYQSGGDTALAIKADDQEPSLQSLASGTGTLLDTLLAAYTAEGSLYLQEALPTESGITFRYGYQINGIPVHFSDESSAAVVTLSDTTVTSLTLQFRQYTTSDTPSLLLPLRQALAISKRHAGAELFIGYADNGGDQLEAVWLAE